MNDFFDVPNPNEKINNVLNNGIEKKENRIKEIEKSISKLKLQKENGKYYTELFDVNGVSAQQLGLIIISIMGDILDGIAHAVQTIKKRGAQQKGGNDNVSQGDSSNTNTFNSTLDTDGLNNAVSNAQTMANDAASKIKDLGIASVKTGIKWSEDFASRMIDAGMEMTGQAGILSTPIDQLSPELNKKIILMAGILKEISENPATREATKEIAEAIAVSVVEILQEIKPELDKITDQALVMLEEVGEKTVRGATSTGISVAQAFIAEIPWVGGVIDLMLALGKGFNAIMETYKVVVDRGGKLGVQGAQMAVNTEQTVMRGKDRIEQATTNAMNKINSSSDNVQRGGSRKTERCIIMGGKRIRKTMKLFQSTLPKIKFPLTTIKKQRKRTRKRIY